MKQLNILLFFLFGLFSMAYSQKDFTPNGSFKIEIGLPNNVTNKAFKELMQGLAIVTPSYQYTFDNSLSIGAGLRYGFFNVNEFKNNIGMNGALHTTGAFIKIGQEKFYGKFGLDYGVRIGYSMNFFATNKNKELHGKPFVDNSGFVEPTIGFGLMASENSSFRLALGYAFHTFKFRPELMGVDKFSGIDPSSLDEITTYFTIGFGYSFYFGRK